MYSANNNMSPEEEFFSEFILNLGCVAYKQAEYIMETYFDCSPNQAERIFRSLSKKGCCTIYGDKQYILAGSKLLHSIAPISRETVEALWIVLDCADENQEGIEEIRDIKRKNMAHVGLMFITGEDAFQTVHVDQSNYLQIMSEYEQIHLENHMKISTIFVFETGTS